jgi:L-lactate dehydrogenase complex protein LldG
MNSPARSRILSNVRAALANKPMKSEVPAFKTPPSWGIKERIEQLKARMTAVRTQVITLPRSGWTDHLKDLLIQQGIHTLIYGPESETGNAVASVRDVSPEGWPELVAYDKDIESFKQTLFEADAAITGTRGGIADTGALILWPDESEPRLMSLVPPIHIAVLDSRQIYTTLPEAMAAQHWSDGMPTNALLISGPSKTADIELIPAFGVHGPVALIVLLLE